MLQLDWHLFETFLPRCKAHLLRFYQSIHRNNVPIYLEIHLLHMHFEFQISLDSLKVPDILNKKYHWKSIHHYLSISHLVLYFCRLEQHIHLKHDHFLLQEAFLQEALHLLPVYSKDQHSSMGVL